MATAWDQLTASGSRRTAVLVAAAALFAGVFLIRVAIEDEAQTVSLLYALPIALLAVEMGVAWAVVGATLAIALFGLWDFGWADEADYDFFDYATRAVALFMLAGVAGGLADRLRAVSAEAARFWELSSDLLCTAGFDGYFKRVNPAWERTLGWTRDELLAAPFIDFVHPDDRARTQAEVERLATPGYQAVNFENRYRCRDGTYLTLVWVATARIDEGVIHASARDLTDAKRAEAELRESAQFLDSVLENLPTMVFVKDAATLQFVRVNRAAEELLGVPRAKLIGKTDHELFPEQQADFSVATDREVLGSGELVNITEEPIETADKRERLLHTRKLAIRDEHSKPRYLLGISEDITDRKLAEHATALARAEAEDANRAKSEFLSRMSHELRTPLNAVIGFSQLLQMDHLDSRQQEAVEQILRAARHLLALINEVLDISRVEAGTMSLSLEPVHLGSLLAEALSLIRPLADDAGVDLAADPAQLGDLHVLADQQRLKQVVINVLSNAVKYNQRGGDITVSWDTSDDARVRLSVRDTGRGMSPDQLRRLFDPFDRLGAERTEIEGTGLGLPLSQRLMEAMGGGIAAESEPDVGTTLSIDMPRAAPPSDASASDEGTPALHAAHDVPRTVVYIEDNLSNLKLVAQLLERLPNVRLITAMLGEVGFELARQHKPDLILLDLHLPDLHGSEVLERLKQDPATADIPVVVVSADATPAQVKRLLGAGAARYVTKPIDVAWLLNACVEGVAAEAPTAAAPRSV